MMWNPLFTTLRGGRIAWRAGLQLILLGVGLLLGAAGCRSGGQTRLEPWQRLKQMQLKLPPAPRLQHFGARRIRRRDQRPDFLKWRGQSPSTERFWSDPATRLPSAAPAQRRGPLGLPPIGELIDDTPVPPGEESTYFPEESGQFGNPDIRSPGPDTANFPNSPYTLRQGRAYIEASPVVLSGPSAGTPPTYNMEFLLRYGLTDRVELRLFGNGPTWQWGRPGAVDGFAPLSWDLKMNFWRENRAYWIPATGLEVALQTPSGTSGLNQGYQPMANLLFDWTLPGEWLLEVNVGFAGDPSVNNQFSQLEPTVQWAFQRELFEDFDIFFHGYMDGTSVPRYGDGVVLGAGGIWALNDRLAVFGSYNAGLSDEAPTTILLLGGAVAF